MLVRTPRTPPADAHAPLHQSRQFVTLVLQLVNTFFILCCYFMARLDKKGFAHSLDNLVELLFSDINLMLACLMWIAGYDYIEEHRF